MSRFTSFLATAQDPIYGISRANISKELTASNWKNKAIVRDGLYLWVARGWQRTREDKKTWRYHVRVHPRDKEEGIRKDFAKRDAALAYANGLSKSEGPLPPEEFPGFHITTLRRAPRAQERS